MQKLRIDRSKIPSMYRFFAKATAFSTTFLVYRWLTEEQREGRRGWEEYDARHVKVVGLEGRPDVMARCRQDPDGLSSAMWGRALTDGKWEWVVRKEGHGIEVGVCSREDFRPSHPFKVVKKEAPSWRGITSLHLNHAGTHTHHYMEVPATATYHFTYDSEASELTVASEGGTASMGTQSSPVQPAVRFTRAGVVEMVEPPKRVD